MTIDTSTREHLTVLLVCGSAAIHSHTRVLLDRLADLLQGRAQVERWDLLTRPLPLADPSHHAHPDHHPDERVRTFVTAVEQSGAIALGSPLYHGSYSGILKNALDLLRWDAFRGRPVGLLSHGANATRCAQPVEHLTSVVRTMYGVNLQTQVCTSRLDYERHTAAPILISEETQTRLGRLADELLACAAMHRSSTPLTLA